MPRSESGPLNWNVSLSNTSERNRATEAYRSGTLFEHGLGHVSVARFRLSGEAEVGVFLVDAYCLGVKNAFYTRLWAEEYDATFLDRVYLEEGKVALSPACARKLVSGAVAYAAALGFSPHPDHRQAWRVMGGFDEGACKETFTFGSEGKPLYIQGPHESPGRVREICRQLRSRCGEGNYHFMIRAEGGLDGF